MFFMWENIYNYHVYKKDSRDFQQKPLRFEKQLYLTCSGVKHTATNLLAYSNR